MLVAAGSNSRSSSNSFGPTARPSVLTPVRLPPGLLRLATNPILTGSSPVRKTIGIVVVAALAASAWGVSDSGNHGHLTAEQIGHHGRQQFVETIRRCDSRSPHSGPRRSRFRPGLRETAKSSRSKHVAQNWADKSDQRHRRLLGARCERPRCCCAAEKGDGILAAAWDQFLGYRLG